ncbi:MAG TPA: hypothetical protein VKA44_02305 [Gemmatimonadota bacterium]|nr:hypothetical protein [Gemmatimonadota bacterium]
MSAERPTEDKSVAARRVTRENGAHRGGPSRLAAAAAALTLLLAPATVRAQDSTAAQEKLPDHDAVKVLMTQDFAAKLDSVPTTLTWDALRKGMAVQYSATKETVQKGDKGKFVFYTALASDGEIAKEHTSDAFEVTPGGSTTAPDAFFPDASMFPDGWSLKGTFVLGEVTVPEDGLMTADVKGVLTDLSEGSPLLFMEAAPADPAARSGLKAAPLILTFQKGSPAPEGG